MIKGKFSLRKKAAMPQAAGRRLVAAGMLVAMALLVLSVPENVIFAAESEEVKVYDEAGLLSETEEQSLAEDVAALEDETGWTVYAVTTEDALGKSSMAYADDFYDTHTDDEDGVLLLVDMDNREVYISTAGIAIRYLTDSRIDKITEAAATYAGNGDYAGCFDKLLDGVESAYKSGIPSGQYNYDTETGKISRYHSISFFEALLAVVLGGAAGVLVYFGVANKYRLKSGTYRYDGHRDGSLSLDRKEDRLINKFVTHHRIQESSGGSGGGSKSRSSTHTSSSGRSHGGGGHGF